MLQLLAEAPGGLGETQTRRLIMEYRARLAFCDFGQWSYAYSQLLKRAWGLDIGPEWEPKWMDCEEGNSTCYCGHYQKGKTPEAGAAHAPGLERGKSDSPEG